MVRGLCALFSCLFSRELIIALFVERPAMHNKRALRAFATHQIRAPFDEWVCTDALRAL
jgi:hypothetical protein